MTEKQTEKGLIYGGIVQEQPCVRTFETGKHEYNCIQYTHFAGARISIPSCFSCGWVDTEAIIKDVLEKFGGKS